MSEDSANHPELVPLSEGETVRVDPEGDSAFISTVDDDRRDTEGDIGRHAVTVIEDGNNASIWDLEAEFDPRDGWSALTAIQRQYLADETVFVERGMADVEIVDPGIDPDRLDPGVTVEGVDGDHYRVVVPPWEREYDDNVLAYNLDSKANVCERVAPSEVIRRVE